MKITNKTYNHIIPDLKQWPIYKFAIKNPEHKRKLVQIIFDELVAKYGDNLKDEISKCAYSELNRIKLNHWKVDPPDEKKFWTEIRRDILERNECDKKEYCHFILKKIINRYVQEIFGDFRISVFKFVRALLTYLFNRLFSGLIKGSIFNLWKKHSLKNKLLVTGYIDEVRNLFKRGVVVFLPTHQSNLDSILLGYIIDFKLGLPAFSYGAGLNLYNYEIAAYFMDRLGAYKVDRRKKNSIYLSSLLSFSKYTVLNNVNSIFYPGGTRSRSGKIEVNLKTGLMSSLVDAQYEKIIEGDDGKIFIVPVIYNYHSVLEAKPLIYSYLKAKGKKKFISRSKYRDKMMRSLSVVKTIYRIFVDRSEFVLSVGKPMDVFGNSVDSDGTSLDSNGNKINVSDYFKTEGELVKDNQRNVVYTKMLSKSVAKSYLKYNTVLSSHLLAYAAYHCLMEKLKLEDVYDLMKFVEKEEFIELSNLENKIEEVLLDLLKREEDGKIILSDDLKQPLENIIISGINKLGAFHDVKVLYFDKKNMVKTEDFGLLYYYANRLSFLK
jgi:glycerol-3-phosphate O-acyltransferase